MTARAPHILDALTDSGETPGKLFIVGTPIGNLKDITLRALETLKQVDLIACEDTRQTQKLLNFYKIRTPTLSYHEHNELTRAPELIIKLQQGNQIALVADAGMPGVSDPGYHLVALAIRHNLAVVPVPGPSAFVAALVASGLPADKFRFLGFLPSRRPARRQALEELRGATKTLIVFEAPHRLLETLKDALEVLGDRPAVVAREVTKIHEQFLRGRLSEIIECIRHQGLKGEITLLIGKADEGQAVPAPPGGSLAEEIVRVMKEQGVNERTALKRVARARRLSRSEAYRQWQMEKRRGPQT